MNQWMKEAEQAYEKALEEESLAYQQLHTAMEVYDRARLKAVEKLKAFNAALKMEKG